MSVKTHTDYVSATVSLRGGQYQTLSPNGFEQFPTSSPDEEGVRMDDIAQAR